MLSLKLPYINIFPWKNPPIDRQRQININGDGSPVDEQAVLATAEAMEEECVAIPWERGDVLWVDNSLVLHARRPFEGQRKILASIAIR